MGLILHAQLSRATDTRYIGYRYTAQQNQAFHSYSIERGTAYFLLVIIILCWRQINNVHTIKMDSFPYSQATTSASARKHTQPRTPAATTPGPHTSALPAPPSLWRHLLSHFSDTGHSTNMPSILIPFNIVSGSTDILRKTHTQKRKKSVEIKDQTLLENK